MNDIKFTFSDTIAGYVTKFDKTQDAFTLETSDRREFRVKFSKSAFAWIANNLEEPRQWCGEQMRDMLVPGRFLFAYGIFYPEGGGYSFEAKHLIFAGATPTTSASSARTGGSTRSAARRLLPATPQFADGKPIDYRNYRTHLTLDGQQDRTRPARRPTPSRAWSTASPRPTC